MFTVNVGGYRLTRNKINNCTWDYFTAAFKMKFVIFSFKNVTVITQYTHEYLTKQC